MAAEFAHKAAENSTGPVFVKSKSGGTSKFFNESINPVAIALDPIAEDRIGFDPTAEDPIAEDRIDVDPIAENRIGFDPIGTNSIAVDPIAEDRIANPHLINSHYDLKSEILHAGMYNLNTKQCLLFHYQYSGNHGSALWTYLCLLETGGDCLSTKLTATAPDDVGCGAIRAYRRNSKKKTPIFHNKWQFFSKIFSLRPEMNR